MRIMNELTTEQSKIYREAIIKVRNFEPFSEEELHALSLLPGVKIELANKIRKGQLLKRVAWSAY